MTRRGIDEDRVKEQGVKLKIFFLRIILLIL